MRESGPFRPPARRRWLRPRGPPPRASTAAGEASRRRPRSTKIRWQPSRPCAPQRRRASRRSYFPFRAGRSSWDQGPVAAGWPRRIDDATSQPDQRLAGRDPDRRLDGHLGRRRQALDLCQSIARYRHPATRTGPSRGWQCRARSRPGAASSSCPRPDPRPPRYIGEDHARQLRRGEAHAQPVHEQRQDEQQHVEPAREQQRGGRDFDRLESHAQRHAAAGPK